ncbi:YoaK family protein [Methylocystis bryophila]|uniref:DUF1275 family protein n=1 Tax=Methylocystis bryophila TaxID=655015 RepID=A0A1W6MTP7_9HYPH|nr:YoaK family protein [Methylocystis bryophila]ARN80981.1 hypothetical protein B1812_07740 [Methylocystis bryophila]BDV36892.1 hypothetical protein DSM21852_01450 [Methylocystis bryophila]
MTDFDSSQERPELADAGLALLSFASGSMDALAFFNLGEVFPSAMTGNTALLGLALGGGHLMQASRPFTAFAGFVAGAALASACVTLWLSKLATPRAVWLLLAFEACLLAGFALAWQFIDRPLAGAGLYGLIIAASSAMGIQSVAARLVGRFGISTVVFTSTLTSIVTTATEAMLQPPHTLLHATKQQIAMFLTYGLGAGLCGALFSYPAWIAVLPFACVVGAAGFHWAAERR